MQTRPSLGIVGAGKVGQTLARLWYEAGYTIVAVNSQTPASAESLAIAVESVAAADPARVMDRADLTLLTVPDDAVEPLASQLAAGSLAGKGVVHTSGVYGQEALAALAARGAMTGSLHPAYPFAGIEQSLAGTTFAVEAENDRLLGWIIDMVAALNGTIMRLPPGSKALYHAALVIASNYTVTLYAVAERLLLTLSEDRAAVDGALNTLVGATVTNLQQRGIPHALTGPLVRGDTGTIAAHLTALAAHDEQVADLYRRLGHLSLPLLAARGVAMEDIGDLLDRT
jgi:predicted short-subunit dehydrogenase-like oxidoreductase (DUF2520 family)